MATAFLMSHASRIKERIIHPAKIHYVITIEKALARFSRKRLVGLHLSCPGIVPYKRRTRFGSFLKRKENEVGEGV